MSCNGYRVFLSQNVVSVVFEFVFSKKRYDAMVFIFWTELVKYVSVFHDDKKTIEIFIEFWFESTISLNVVGLEVLFEFYEPISFSRPFIMNNTFQIKF